MRGGGSTARRGRPGGYFGDKIFAQVNFLCQRQFVLEDLVVVESVQLQVPAGGIDERVLRDKADQLAALHADAVAGSLTANGIHHPVQRRFGIVGQVHRNLGAPIYQHAHRFDEAVPTREVANAAGYLASDLNVAAVEVDIESHQRGACSDDNRSSRAKFGWSEIRLALGVALDLLLEPLILASPDPGQVDPFGRGGGGFIQVHWQIELGGHPLTQLLSQDNALGRRDALQRHQRHHIGCADARVFAAVLVEVDQLCCLRNGVEGCLQNVLRRASEGDHAAVVVRVRTVVEQGNCLN